MPKRRTGTPENRRATGGHAGRFAPGNTAGVGTQFQPGQSGNPGGRPRSLAAHIREKVGGNAELIVDELLAVLTNQKRTAWGRVQAAALLLNRGWGREPLTVMVETPEEGHVDLRYATNEELDQLEEIYRRVDARALEGRDQRLLPAPLTAGQGDVGSHVGNTMVNADDIATE